MDESRVRFSLGPPMFPDTPNNQEDPKGRLKIILPLVLLVALGVGGYFVVTKKPNEARQQTATSTPAEEISIKGSRQQSYQSNVENIRFSIPYGWSISEGYNPPLPAGLENPTVSLVKANSTCVISKASPSENFRDLNKDVSFGERVYSQYSQFDGYWYVSSTSESSKYSFSWHTRQPLPGEFRQAYYRYGNFVLFTSDRSIVPKDCESDFNLILTTMEPHFETAQLDLNSKGMLSYERVWDDLNYDERNKSYEHLVFIPDGSKEKREIMKIPETINKNIYVHKGKLYAAENSYQPGEGGRGGYLNSAIYVIDPFSKQVGQINGSTSTDSYIASL